MTRQRFAGARWLGDGGRRVSRPRQCHRPATRSLQQPSPRAPPGTAFAAAGSAVVVVAGSAVVAVAGGASARHWRSPV